MHALIEKASNEILRVAPEGYDLAESKPVFWVECPPDCTTAWSFSLPNTFTPPPGPTLAEALASKRAEIEAWRDAEEHAAIVFTHDLRNWDGGLRVRDRLQPVVALPALPEGFYWTDADNNDVPMTLGDVLDLNAAHEAAIVQRGFAIHARQREMKEDVDAMTDPADVAAYPVGWPPEEGE